MGIKREMQVSEGSPEAMKSFTPFKTTLGKYPSLELIYVTGHLYPGSQSIHIMASFEPITAKDFQTNNKSILPTQVDVHFYQNS